MPYAILCKAELHEEYLIIRFYSFNKVLNAFNDRQKCHSILNIIYSFEVAFLDYKKELKYKTKLANTTQAIICSEKLILCIIL